MIKIYSQLETVMRTKHMALTNAEIADLLKIALKTKIRQKNNFTDNPTISGELGKKIAEIEILINNITVEKTPIEEYIAKSMKNK